MPDRDDPKACPWCGVLETAPRRRWHPDCVALYRIACFSEDQRRAVWRRDRGQCAGCGLMVVEVPIGWKRAWPLLATYHQEAPPHVRFENLKPNSVPDYRSWYCGVEPIFAEWFADHIKPLWSRPADLPLDQREAWWGLSNLQTLCRACHDAKTAREAAERAALRRR